MSANTNPGGVDFNNSPYFDDYDEDKKFARILYVPGRAVQARELTQAQTIQQKQIQRFANYFFNAGSILDGCENNLDYSVSFVKLQPNYNSEEVNVSSFLYSEVIGANTGIKAYVGIVSDIETFQNIKVNNPDFIVQEYLDGKQGEFTCGLFRAKDLSIRSIIIKRELMGGFTGYGEIIKNVEISETLSAIAEKIKLFGSINVQLRLTDKGPVVFEINPRFSSTVRFRHLLGFKDLDWSIQDMFDEEISKYDDDSEGKRIFKGFNEYIS